MNTDEEFQETITNLGNIEADFNSTVGHTKALPKLVRS